MLEDPLAALDAMEQATGEREANVIGYCLGGTLLAPALAYMTTQGDDHIASATYFVALTDFAEARRTLRLHRRGSALRRSKSE